MAKRCCLGNFVYLASEIVNFASATEKKNYNEAGKLTAKTNCAGTKGRRAVAESSVTLKGHINFLRHLVRHKEIYLSLV